MVQEAPSLAPRLQEDAREPQTTDETLHAVENLRTGQANLTSELLELREELRDVKNTIAQLKDATKPQTSEEQGTPETLHRIDRRLHTIIHAIISMDEQQTRALASLEQHLRCLGTRYKTLSIKITHLLYQLYQ